MQYFYHSSIKNYTIALLDMFNDIRIPRINANGDRIADIIIPIKFGNKDKAYTISEHDIENLHTGNVNTLPRMVLAFDSMVKAPERDTNKLNKVNRRNLSTTDKLIMDFQHNPVAYDFNFTIYVATRTFTDATIIVEQIAPMFRPDISLKIQELDVQDVPTTVPVTLGDFSIELPDEMDDEDIRIIQTEFSITLKGNLYLPIKDSKLINNINLHMDIIEQERNKAATTYNIDTIVI